MKGSPAPWAIHLLLIVILFLLIKYRRQILHIINGWLSPGWKSQDYEKQIKWINKANPAKQKHRDILVILSKDGSWAVRQAAAEKIPDQKVLAVILRKEESEKVCKSVIHKIIDDSLLKDLADNARLYHVRETAREKLGLENNTSALIDTATNSKDNNKRKASLVKLPESELQNVFRNSREYELRTMILELLNDQSALSEIARKESDSRLRKSAAGKLTDQKTLASIAIKDEDSEVRSTAKKKITDTAILTSVIKHGKNKNWLSSWEKLSYCLNGLPISTHDSIRELEDSIKTAYPAYNFAEKKLPSLESALLYYAGFPSFLTFVENIQINQYIGSSYTESDYGCKTIYWLNYWIARQSENEFIALSATAIEYLD